VPPTPPAAADAFLQAYEGWKQRREAQRLQKEADKAAKEVGAGG
jgi:hypothetical protein